MAKQDPDYAIKICTTRTASEDFPVLDLRHPVNDLKQAEIGSQLHPFDVTKVWPSGDLHIAPGW